MNLLCRILGHDIKYDQLHAIVMHIRKNEDFDKRKFTVHCKRCGFGYDFSNEVLR